MLQFFDFGRLWCFSPKRDHAGVGGSLFSQTPINLKLEIKEHVRAITGHLAYLGCLGASLSYPWGKMNLTHSGACFTRFPLSPAESVHVTEMPWCLWEYCSVKMTYKYFKDQFAYHTPLSATYVATPKEPSLEHFVFFPHCTTWMRNECVSEWRRHQWQTKRP